MLFKEYRIVLPMTVEEYQVAQLWSVAEASKNETGGGEGVEIVANEPYEDGDERGQYTHKVHRLTSRLPRSVVVLSRSGDPELTEEAWNRYTYCKTVVTNPAYMKDNFDISIKSLYLPDLGDSENVHKLSQEDWKATQVVKIDIANTNLVEPRDYNAEFDPLLVKSEKAQRGPLSKNWIEQLRAKKLISESTGDSQEKPAYMCAYKLVSCHFKWFGLQNRMENMIHKEMSRLFLNFNRQVFCWMDKWFGLTMDKIRKIEEQTKIDLLKMRAQGSIRGMGGLQLN